MGKKEVLSSGYKRITIEIPYDIYTKSKLLIEFKSALIFGISYFLAQKTGENYPKMPEIEEKQEKINKLRVQLEALSKELYELQERNRTPKDEKETREFIQGLGKPENDTCNDQ